MGNFETPPPVKISIMGMIMDSLYFCDVGMVLAHPTFLSLQPTGETPHVHVFFFHATRTPPPQTP